MKSWNLRLGLSTNSSSINGRLITSLTMKILTLRYLRLKASPVFASLFASTGKFIPTRRTPGVSTSELLERIVSGYRKRDWDKKLEKIGHPELMAAGSDYDSSREGSVGYGRGK
jgi:hypothetical protein